MKLSKKLAKSPINYYSDLFIVVMVLGYLGYIVVCTLAAASVTVSGLIFSFRTGCWSVDTSLWDNLGNHIMAPLTAGGAIWMIKCGVQHAIFDRKGVEPPHDFPDTEAYITHEEEVKDDIRYGIPENQVDLPQAMDGRDPSDYWPCDVSDGQSS